MQICIIIFSVIFAGKVELVTFTMMHQHQHNQTKILLAFLEYFNNPNNQKKYQMFSNLEKELLYYFEKISDDDKKRDYCLYPLWTNQNF